MTISLVDTVSPEDLKEERRQISVRLGLTEEELLHRGEEWTLHTEDEWQAFDRLKGIRFLLGEDD